MNDLCSENWIDHSFKLTLVKNQAMSAQLSEILKLSVSERILLVEAIWDSIANETQNVKPYQLTEEQMRFLEEELIAYRKNPEDVTTWDEIKNKALKRK
ncbi:MAG: addiction module protein [Bacteroidota bacterium]|nr:addiction module protein [Bacteroidota bacterium]